MVNISLQVFSVLGTGDLRIDYGPNLGTKMTYLTDVVSALDILHQGFAPGRYVLGPFALETLGLPLSPGTHEIIASKQP